MFAATSDIGSALCRKLREAQSEGVTLHVTGRNSERTKELARSLGATPWTADVTSFEDVDRTIKGVARADGRIDGVVQCAGSVLLKPAHTTSVEEWSDTLRVNLDSAFFTIKSGARAMMRTGGSIVLMSSAAARVGLVNHEAIAAAKAGVAGLALSAAATYAARGIRVNCLAPGMVRSSLTERLLTAETARSASEAMHPLGRIGEPGDVASMIEWLLDPDQSWVTGQVFGVDGGLATLRGRVKV